MTGFDAGDIYRSEEFQQELALQKTFMARVFGWMTIGLLITAISAFAVDATPAVSNALFHNNGLALALFIGWFILGIGMRTAIFRLPVAVATFLFLLYSAVTGAELSSLLLFYSRSSLYMTFFITAGMFGGAAAVGYVTKRNLSGMGSFLIMALWGLIIATIVNFFFASAGLDWLINYAGVIIFTGLTMYHVQMIKQLYADGGPGSKIASQNALMGAFALYLNFINLFLFLIRIFGSRRD